MSREIVRNGGTPWSTGNGNQLTPEMEEFVEEYLKCLNGPQAAKRAGSRYPFADSKRWLDDDRVKERLERRWMEVSRSREITPEHVLEEVANLAFSNIQDLYTEEGHPVPLYKLPRHVAASIRGIKRRVLFDREGTPTGETLEEIQLWDKSGPQNTLMKYLGLFEKDNRQKGLDAEGWKALLGALFESLPAGMVAQVMDGLRSRLKMAEVLLPEGRGA